MPRESDAGALSNKANKGNKANQMIRIKEKRDLKQKNRFKKDKADLKLSCMKLLWRK